MPQCCLKYCTKNEGVAKFSSSEIWATVRVVVFSMILAWVMTDSAIQAVAGLPVMRLMAAERYLREFGIRKSKKVGNLADVLCLYS